MIVPTAHAAASDSKVYPASMCQPASSSHAARASFTGNGRVCNTSADTELILRCPVVRDFVDDLFSYVRVYAKNSHPSRNVTCVMRTLRPDTADGWGWFEQLVIGLDPMFANPDIWQSVQSTANLGEVADGPYELSCSLPPAALWGQQLKQSCLGAYYASEKEKE